jgi:hypothetical protein
MRYSLTAMVAVGGIIVGLWGTGRAAEPGKAAVSRAVAKPRQSCAVKTPAPLPSLRSTMKPTRPSFELGEPIWLDLTLENLATETYIIPTAFVLSEDEFDGVYLTWRRVGSNGKAKSLSRIETLSPLGKLLDWIEIPRKKTYQHSVLLNRWLVADEPGEFELTLRLRDVPVSASTIIRLEKPTPEGQRRLARQAEQWLLAWQTMDGTLSLTFTRSPAVVQFQNRLLDHYASSYGRPTDIVNSMLLGDQNATAEFFVVRLRDAGTHRNIKRAILDGIKKVGVTNLAPEVQKKLEPFRQAIEKVDENLLPK